MGLFFDKNTLFKIHVSFENQNKMKKHINDSYSPLFVLSANQSYSVKFEHKTITCSFLKEVHQFLYKDVQKIIITSDGIVIYFNNQYISVSTEKDENHNTDLYDIVSFLKRRCPFKFLVKNPICYPKIEDDGKYKSDKANLKISFSLTDLQINKCCGMTIFLLKE